MWSTTCWTNPAQEFLFDAHPPGIAFVCTSQLISSGRLTSEDSWGPAIDGFWIACRHLVAWFTSVPTFHIYHASEYRRASINKIQSRDLAFLFGLHQAGQFIQISNVKSKACMAERQVKDRSGIFRSGWNCCSNRLYIFSEQWSSKKIASLPSRQKIYRPVPNRLLINKTLCTCCLTFSLIWLGLFEQMSCFTLQQRIVRYQST